MKYHYTYMLHGDISYIGVRSSKCLPELDIKYWGSSKHTPKNISETHTKLILAEFPTRKEAVEHEIQLHNFYEVSTNDMYYNKAKQTTTGFDTLGVPSLNRDKTIYQFIHDKYGKEVCSQYELSIKYNLHRPSISLLTTGKLNSSEGWRLSSTPSNHVGQLKGSAHYKYNSTNYQFTHEKHGEVNCTMFELYKNYNLHPGEVSSIVLGNVKSHRGWRLSSTPISDVGKIKGQKHYRFDHTIYYLIHNEYGEEQDTNFELREKTKLTRQEIYQLTSNKRQQVKGWRLNL